MADQVPAAIRIARRDRTVRRTRLSAVSAAFVIGAGTLVVAAPWSANTNVAPGEQSMSLRDYHRLVDSTVIGLWPAATGFGAPATVGVHFGDDPVPVALWTGAAGRQLPPPQLAVAQVDRAYAQRAETCPELSAAQSSTEFCTTTTLPDGTVVKADNVVAVDLAAQNRPVAVPFQDQNPESFRITKIPAAGSTAPTGGTTPPYWGLEEVQVWHAAAVEVLLIPAEYTTVAAGTGTAGTNLKADPDAGQLTAIGTAESFRGLLDTAVAAGLVPGADVPQEAVPIQCLPATGTLDPSAIGSAGSASPGPTTNPAAPGTPVTPGDLVLTQACQPSGPGGTTPASSAGTPSGSSDPTPDDSAPSPPGRATPTPTR